MELYILTRQLLINIKERGEVNINEQSTKYHEM